MEGSTVLPIAFEQRMRETHLMSTSAPSKESHGQPAQTQPRQPGIESEMRPRPRSEDANVRGSGKLSGKVALVTGGDSGIGRATALAFAREGADVVVAFLEEREDARETAEGVKAHGRKCHLFAGDLGRGETCRELIDYTLEKAGRLDVLVNNAAEQHPRRSLAEISEAQLERTFRTNFYAYFYLTKAALPHLRAGATIVNTTSVTAYSGHPELIDYASTKGAIVAFTRSLALSLAAKGIRVNAVAPGPIWTPLIPATFPADEVASFGTDTPIGRAGQPDEVAPCYVFLASDDSRYMTGQVLHPNGGRIVNG